MPTLSEPRPAQPAEESVAESVAEPLLRDPPPPPGYVDPLAGSVALDPTASRPLTPLPGRPHRGPGASGSASG